MFKFNKYTYNASHSTLREALFNSNPAKEASMRNNCCADKLGQNQYKERNTAFIAVWRFRQVKMEDNFLKQGKNVKKC